MFICNLIFIIEKSANGTHQETHATLEPFINHAQLTRVKISIKKKAYLKNLTLPLPQESRDTFLLLGRDLVPHASYFFEASRIPSKHEYSPPLE